MLMAVYGNEYTSTFFPVMRRLGPGAAARVGLCPRSGGG